MIACNNRMMLELNRHLEFQRYVFAAPKKVKDKASTYVKLELSPILGESHARTRSDLQLWIMQQRRSTP